MVNYDVVKQKLLDKENVLLLRGMDNLHTLIRWNDRQDVYNVVSFKPTTVKPLSLILDHITHPETWDTVMELQYSGTDYGNVDKVVNLLHSFAEPFDELLDTEGENVQ